MTHQATAGIGPGLAYHNAVESTPNPRDWSPAHEQHRRSNSIIDASDGREVFIAEHAGKPLGFLQIMDPTGDPGAYWGGLAPGHRAIDIWIGDGERLRRGLGTVMMPWALGRPFTAPEVHSVLLDPLASNTRANRFYHRLGFHKESERQFDEDHCFVLRLTREVWLNSVKLSVNDRPIGGEMNPGIPFST